MCRFESDEILFLGPVNSYKLDNKDQDQNFLAGKPVKGKALFLASDYKDDSIKVDGRIVIVLSNGRKYMGKVTRFTFVSKGEIIEGEVEIIKA